MIEKEIEEDEEFDEPKSVRASKHLHRPEGKSWALVKSRAYFLSAVQQETHWKDMGIARKALFVILDAPFDFLRRICMPPPADDVWFRPFAAGAPFFGTIFVFLSQGLIDFEEGIPTSFWVTIGIAVVVGIGIYMVTERDKPPKWSILFSIITFVMSILWIEQFSGICVDIIGLLGIILDINTAYLGITVLAIGNSLGDMVANLSVAKRGLA